MDNERTSDYRTVFAFVTLLILIGSLSINMVQCNKYAYAERSIEEQKAAIKEADSKLDLYLEQLVSIRSDLSEVKADIKNLKEQIDRIENKMEK